MLHTRAYARLDDGAADVKPGTGAPIHYVASSAGEKRDGMSLDPERWMIENFHRAGGPVLWMHKTDIPPIGSATAKRDGRKLVADVTYDPDDPFAVTVESKVRRRFMRGISVSWDFCNRDGSRLSYGRAAGGRLPAHLMRDAWQDLTELSNVAVPMDPDALAQRAWSALRAAGLIDERTWRDYDDPDSDVTADELVPDLVESVIAEFASRGVDLRAAVEWATTRGAIPPHVTPRDPDMDAEWDADAELEDVKDGEQLKRMHAWMDPDGDPDDPESFKLPHHHADGTVNWRALGNAMARLNQADIPDDELAACHAHLAGHYAQYEREAPSFRAAIGLHTRAWTPDPPPPLDHPATPGLDPRAAVNLIAALSFGGAA